MTRILLVKFYFGDSGLRFLFIYFWSHSLLPNAKNLFCLWCVKSLKAQGNAAELSLNRFRCEGSETCYTAMTLQGHMATKAWDEDAVF